MIAAMLAEADFVPNGNPAIAGFGRASSANTSDTAMNPTKNATETSVQKRRDGEILFK